MIHRAPAFRVASGERSVEYPLGLGFERRGEAWLSPLSCPLSLRRARNAGTASLFVESATKVVRPGFLLLI